MEYLPFVKGVLIGVFLATTTDLTFKNFKWWVAMLSLVVITNI